MKATRHIIVAGMTLTLAFGMTPAAALAAEDANSEIVGESDGSTPEGSSGSSTDSNAFDEEGESASEDASIVLEAVEEPEGYDKEDFYEEDPTAALARSLVMPFATTFTPVSVSSEMKYFSKWESHSNYDQGLSAGDDYHAMGYYQFDNRYGLDSFLIACYNYDPETYSMFKWIADGADITGDLYDSKKGTLTAVGQKLENSWHAAYKANPSGFSALQDSWAYEKYYKPAESYLKSIGIDISGRADCVKGLVWGMSNLFGTSGWKKFVGGSTSGYDWNGVWHNSYKWPGAWNGDYKKANSMSDREFVTTLCNYVVENVGVFYKAQPQYHQGWQNRYRDELNICLSYIAVDEAQQADSLSYNANGGTGKMSATEGTVNKGVKVASNFFTREGYEFIGWNTKKDGSGKAYAAGSTYTLTDGDDVLYAQWKKVENDPVVPSTPDSSNGVESGGSDSSSGESSGGDSGSGTNGGSGTGSDADGNVSGDGDANGEGSGDGESNDIPNEPGEGGGSSDADGEGSGGADFESDGTSDPTQPAPPSNNVILGGSSSGSANSTPNGAGGDAESDEGESQDGDGGSNAGGNGDSTNPGTTLGASGSTSGGSAAGVEDDSTKEDASEKDANKENASDEDAAGDSGKKRDSSSSDEGKDTLLKTNDESAGIIAVLVGGFALAFGVAAGTLRRMLGRS